MVILDLQGVVFSIHASWNVLTCGLKLLVGAFCLFLDLFFVLVELKKMGLPSFFLFFGTSILR
jgi:hypothetical protein